MMEINDINDKDMELEDNILCDDDDDDSEYDYTGEDEDSLGDDDVDVDDDFIEDQCRFDWLGDEDEDSLSRTKIGDGNCVDWEYCQKENILLSRRMELEQPQVYAPERGPPLLDFLFVLTAFFAATFAAFYTILSETGVPNE